MIGRYRVVRQLAEGGMGRVLLAEVLGPSGFHRRVVLKLVRDDLSALQRSALVHEARVAASLSHKNLVPVLDLEEIHGRHVVVIDYLEGPDLRQLLNRRGAVPWALAAYIASEVAAGLDFAHRKTDTADQPLGLVHRDVNPSNILVSWEGEVKLTDFGVATAAALQAAAATEVAGKRGYMAPEQAEGRPVDGRADVFALGRTLAEMLSGLSPVLPPPGPPGQRPPVTWPSALGVIIDRACERDREARYSSAAELRAALLRVPGQPADPAAELREWIRGLRASTLGGAALLEAALADGRPITAMAEGQAGRGNEQETRFERPAPMIAPTESRTRLLVGVIAAASLIAALVGILLVRQPDSSQPAAASAETTDSGSARPGSLPVVAADPEALPPSPSGVSPRTPETASAGPQPKSPARSRPAPRRVGTLAVNSVPWAQVFVDGRASGRTPRTGIRLGAGAHQVRLVTAGGEVRTRRVAIDAGRETRLSVDFSSP